MHIVLTEEQLDALMNSDIEHSDYVRADDGMVKEMYDKANEELFKGLLPEIPIYCASLGGRAAGLFSFGSDGVRYNRYNRRILKPESEDYVKNMDDFMLCNPVIRINNQFKARKSSIYNTVVHEMCHAYVYIGYGFKVPRQAHGVEFRDVARLISINSKGELSINRVWNAENEGEMIWDEEMKEKKTNRENNKYNSIVYFVFELFKDGIHRDGGIYCLDGKKEGELIDYYNEVYGSRLDTFKFDIYKVIDEELKHKLFYDVGIQSKAKTPRSGFYRLERFPEIFNINDDLNEDSRLEKIYSSDDSSIDNREVEGEIDEINNSELFEEFEDDSIEKIPHGLNLSRFSPIEVNND